MSTRQEELQVKIGRSLKQLRLDAGYTSYRSWADEHSIEPKHLWELEKGKSDFKLSSLTRILDIHEVDIQDFFKGL